MSMIITKQDISSFFLRVNLSTVKNRQSIQVHARSYHQFRFYLFNVLFMFPRNHPVVTSPTHQIYNKKGNVTLQ